jgi:hypothetical protein
MKKLTLLYSLALLIALIACKKKKEDPNPFDDPSLQPPAKPTQTYNPDPASFEYLFNNVFNPTCANSNCHDGSFEPDFRNITSAYNTLVYAPVIISPTSTPISYRVLPGNANASLLKYRLTQVPGSGPGTLGQGRMPWNDTMFKFSASGGTYVQKIIDWINNGAKDIFGHDPVPGNKNPNALGFNVCDAGSLTNKSRNYYLEIPKTNGPVDFWFYVNDDLTLPQNMQMAQMKISTNRYDFTAATTLSMTYVPNGPSYLEITKTNNVQYTHKVSNFNLATIQPDTGYVYIRTYFRDADHPTYVETPNNGTMYYTNYWIIKIVP